MIKHPNGRGRTGNPRGGHLLPDGSREHRYSRQLAEEILRRLSMGEGTTPPPKLHDLGINYNQSSQWQTLADIPPDQFEVAIPGPNRPTPPASPQPSYRRLHQTPYPRGPWLCDETGHRGGWSRPYPEWQSPALGTKRDSRRQSGQYYTPHPAPRWPGSRARKFCGHRRYVECRHLLESNRSCSERPGPV